MRNLLIVAAAIVVSTGAALAQGVPAAPPATASVSTNAGPSVSVTTTQKTRDANGAETDRVQTYDQRQSFTSGDGALSAKTTTERSERSTVMPPPPTVTKRSVTTTTTETTR